MSPPEAISEIIILYAKEGVSVDTQQNSVETQEFIRLYNIIKSHKGSREQYWGYQVENPNIFVWYIDWESGQHKSAFTASKQYDDFVGGFDQLFDLTVAPPLRICVRWSSDMAAAMQAPVTEVSFFKLPDAPADGKAAIEQALAPTMQAVQTFGNASGAALGWVSEVTPPGKETMQPGEEWLHGVFGYASIDVHMEWRKHSEHAKAGKAFAELAQKGLVLHPAAMVPGVDPATGYFHVKFHHRRA